MEAQRANRKSGIVMVEDNPHDVNLLQLALSNAGVEFDMTVIEDGGEALTFFRDFDEQTSGLPPELVILDLHLPKHDGVEIVQTLRRNSAFNEVAVVLLSSSSLTVERQCLEACRVKRYITKPPDLDGYYNVGVLLRDLLTDTPEFRDARR